MPAGEVLNFIVAATQLSFPKSIPSLPIIRSRRQSIKTLHVECSYDNAHFPVAADESRAGGTKAIVWLCLIAKHAIERTVPDLTVFRTS
jgi:hypothetical protein